MKTDTKKKFQVNPAREVVATMTRLIRVGIDPGETIPQVVQRFLTHSYDNDINDGEVIGYLKHHDEE